MRRPCPAVHLFAAILLAVAAGACGESNSTSPAADTSSADTSGADTSSADSSGADASGDTAGDASADTAVPGDIAADSVGDAAGDASADTVPDTAADTAQDSAGDASADIAPDAPGDTAEDSAVEPDSSPADGGPTPSMCGGIAGFQCKGPDETCDMQGCYPDAAGSCVPVPDGCPKIYMPVCGCDGKTYDNDCFRVKAGAAKDHDGACKPAPSACSPADPSSCGPDKYCALPAGQCSGDGSCALKPGGCIALYDPVCGCDGKTYGNACSAASSGVSVASKGECSGGACNVNGDCPSGQGCKDGHCEPCGNGVCPKIGCPPNSVMDSCTCTCQKVP